jgi:serine/threonine protein kinase
MPLTQYSLPYLHKKVHAKDVHADGKLLTAAEVSKVAAKLAGLADGLYRREFFTDEMPKKKHSILKIGNDIFAIYKSYRQKKVRLVDGKTIVSMVKSATIALGGYTNHKGEVLAVLRLAQNIRTGEWHGVKVIKRENAKPDDPIPDDIQLEFSNLEKVGKAKADKVVSCNVLDVANPGVKYFLMMQLEIGHDLCDLANLQQFKNIAPDGFTTSRIPHLYWIDAIVLILKSFKNFHDSGFLHCDIKPENITYSFTDRQVGIVDFATMSQKTASGDAIQGIYGTDIFIPPEFYQLYDETKKTLTSDHKNTDIWSALKDAYDKKMEVKMLFVDAQAEVINAEEAVNEAKQALTVERSLFKEMQTKNPVDDAAVAIQAKLIADKAIELDNLLTKLEGKKDLVEAYNTQMDLMQASVEIAAAKSDAELHRAHVVDAVVESKAVYNESTEIYSLGRVIKAFLRIPIEERHTINQPPLKPDEQAIYMMGEDKKRINRRLQNEKKIPTPHIPEKYTKSVIKFTDAMSSRLVPDTVEDANKPSEKRSKKDALTEIKLVSKRPTLDEAIAFFEDLHAEIAKETHLTVGILDAKEYFYYQDNATHKEKMRLNEVIFSKVDEICLITRKEITVADTASYKQLAFTRNTIFDAGIICRKNMYLTPTLQDIFEIPAMLAAEDGAHSIKRNYIYLDGLTFNIEARSDLTPQAIEKCMRLQREQQMDLVESGINVVTLSKLSAGRDYTKLMDDNTATVTKSDYDLLVRELNAQYEKISKEHVSPKIISPLSKNPQPEKPDTDVVTEKGSETLSNGIGGHDASNHMNGVLKKDKVNLVEQKIDVHETVIPGANGNHANGIDVNDTDDASQLDTTSATSTKAIDLLNEVLARPEQEDTQSGMNAQSQGMYRMRLIKRVITFMNKWHTENQLTYGMVATSLNFLKKDKSFSAAYATSRWGIFSRDNCVKQIEILNNTLYARRGIKN